MARKGPEELEAAYNLLLVILYLPLVPLPILLLPRLLLLFPTPPLIFPLLPSHLPSPSSFSRSSTPSFFSTPLVIPPARGRPNLHDLVAL